VSPFDRLLFGRTLLAWLVLEAAAAAVVTLTDEPGSTAGMRLARLSVFAPALGALALRLTLGLARRRGELRALAALGLSLPRAAQGALFAGWAAGALGLVSLLLPAVELDALFPRVGPFPEWSAPGPGTWVALGQGVTVGGATGLSLAPDAGAVLAGLGGWALGRWQLVLLLCPLALLLPPWVAGLEPPARFGFRAGAELLATLLATVFLLHAVGAGWLGPGWLLLAVLPLLPRGGGLLRAALA
jgi:hypothetical protein